MKHNLHTLMGRVKGTSKPRIRAAVVQDELLLEIYGDIGASFWGDGVTVSQVSEQLNAAPLTIKAVNVHINSPGGDVFEGVAIYNVLKAFPRPVNVTVDGLAASAASVIAMAGDKLLMQKGTMLMIHPAMWFVAGTSVDLREAATILETVTGQIADIYAEKTGIPKAELLQMMYAETWMTPEDAISKGFADSASETSGDALSVAASFDLAAFTNTPEHLKVFAGTQGEVTSERLLIRKRYLDFLT